MVIGGDVNSGHYQTDIWCGTPNIFGGLDWICTNANAAPLAQGRVLFQVFDHLDKIWIVGGQTLDDLTPENHANPPSTKTGSPYYSDVQCSDDFGGTWDTVSTGNAWAPCGLIMGSPVMDGHMWLVGAGAAYDTAGQPRLYGHKIYKSADGIYWPLVAENAFPARQYHNALVLKNRLVVLFGVGAVELADGYVANRAGDDWRQLGPFPGLARHAAAAVAVANGHEAVVMDGKLHDTAVWGLAA